MVADVCEFIQLLQGIKQKFLYDDPSDLHRPRPTCLSSVLLTQIWTSHQRSPQNFPSPPETFMDVDSNQYKNCCLLQESLLLIYVAPVSLVYHGFGGSAAYLCRYENTNTLLVNKAGILLKWRFVAEQETFRSTSLTDLDPLSI